MNRQTPESFFSRKRKSKNGCWNFTGCINPISGYGISRYNGKNGTAHRIAWIILHGEINNSKILVCHTCDNRRCINPDHLFLGTHKDNVQDMLRKNRGRKKGKTCGKGHKLTKSNAYIYPDGRQECRICKHNTWFKWYKRTCNVYLAKKRELTKQKQLLNPSKP